MKKFTEVESAADVRALVKDGALSCGNQYSRVRKFLLTPAQFSEQLSKQGASVASISEALLTQAINVYYTAGHGNHRIIRYLAD